MCKHFDAILSSCIYFHLKFTVFSHQASQPSSNWCSKHRTGKHSHRISEFSNPKISFLNRCIFYFHKYFFFEEQSIAIGFHRRICIVFLVFSSGTLAMFDVLMTAVRFMATHVWVIFNKLCKMFEQLH